MTDKEILDMIAVLLAQRNNALPNVQPTQRVLAMELQEMLDDEEWSFRGMGTASQREKARDFCSDNRVRNKPFSQLTDPQQGYLGMLRDKRKRFHNRSGK